MEIAFLDKKYRKYTIFFDFMLQRAVFHPNVLSVLLQHLPSASSENTRRQHILDALDQSGHSALSLACFDHAPGLDVRAAGAWTLPLALPGAAKIALSWCSDDSKRCAEHTHR